MCEVVCKYKHKCTSYDSKCYSCVNNDGRRDYYKPDPIPNPYWWPWWTYKCYWTTGQNPNYVLCSGDPNDIKSDYYSTNVTC